MQSSKVDVMGSVGSIPEVADSSWYFTPTLNVAATIWATEHWGAGVWYTNATAEVEYLPDRWYRDPAPGKRRQAPRRPGPPQGGGLSRRRRGSRPRKSHPCGEANCHTFRAHRLSETSGFDTPRGGRIEHRLNPTGSASNTAYWPGPLPALCACRARQWGRGCGGWG